jgi:ubiquinone/menaquinone biosynthesis C-methylase UbiE
MLKVLSIRINRFIRNIPCVLMSFKEEKVVRKINNYKMNLYLSDKGIARELFSYGKREHFTTDLVQEGNIIKTGDVILDLGANIGYCALMEAKMVGPTGKIYAVEPSPINFNRLKENIL